MKTWTKIIKLQVPQTTILMYVGNAEGLGKWLEELQETSDKIIGKDLKNKIKKNILEDDEYVKSFDRCNGRFVKVSSRGGLLFVNGKFKRERQKAIAVHEIVHVLDCVGDIFRINDREYRAYLGEFLYQEFCQMYKTTKGERET